MRLRSAVLPLAATALAASLAPAGPAASPSMTPDMPPEVLSLRREILASHEYAQLADRWREYAEQHPESAVARVQQARALRYQGQASPEELSQLIREAWEMDPDCPEALEAVSTTVLGTPAPLLDSIEEGIRIGEKVVELAPDWPEPHFGLWTHCTLLGRTEEAADHLRAIVRKGGHGAPLLDFAHNMLVSAEPAAILFTNGDNDTYPPLALQAIHDLRKDVAIINLSLLNHEKYARSAWKQCRDGGPFDAAELETLVGRPKKEGRKRLSPLLVEALVEKVRSGAWKKPVYFALTVAPSRLECCEGSLTIEGLLWRLSADARPQEVDEEPAVDGERTLRLFREEFRLESATDLAWPWGGNDAVTRILSNYPAVLRIVATENAKRGDVSGVRFAMRKSLEILTRHGETDQAKAFAEYWKELEPGNPEVDRWL